MLFVEGCNYVVYCSILPRNGQYQMQIIRQMLVINFMWHPIWNNWVFWFNHKVNLICTRYNASRMHICGGLIKGKQRFPGEIQNWSKQRQNCFFFFFKCQIYHEQVGYCPKVHLSKVHVIRNTICTGCKTMFYWKIGIF